MAFFQKGKSLFFGGLKPSGNPCGPQWRSPQYGESFTGADQIQVSFKLNGL
jgi:hypothetical protein